MNNDEVSLLRRIQVLINQGLHISSLDWTAVRGYQCLSLDEIPRLPDVFRFHVGLDQGPASASWNHAMGLTKKKKQQG